MFKPGQRIPYCHLKAEMTNKRKKSAPKLLHQVKLLGAKHPYNIITIDLDLQQTLPGQNDTGFLRGILWFFLQKLQLVT